MYDQHAVPSQMGLGTLFDVLVGWESVGAAATPRRVFEVEQRTGRSGVVGPQTALLADLGLLEFRGSDRGYQLTESGSDLARALAVDDPERARAHAYSFLAGTSLTEDVRGLVRANPLPTDRLVPLVAAITDRHPVRPRDRAAVLTVLDFFEWAGALVRDDSGQYRLPEATTSHVGVDGGTREIGTKAGDDSEDESGNESSTEDIGGGDSKSDTESHALSLGVGVDSLEVTVDGEPEHLEGIIRALRQGLTPDETE